MQAKLYFLRQFLAAEILNSKLEINKCQRSVQFVKDSGNLGQMTSIIIAFSNSDIGQLKLTSF